MWLLLASSCGITGHEQSRVFESTIREHQYVALPQRIHWVRSDVKTVHFCFYPPVQCCLLLSSWKIPKQTNMTDESVWWGSAVCRWETRWCMVMQSFAFHFPCRWIDAIYLMSTFGTESQAFNMFSSSSVVNVTNIPSANWKWGYSQILGNKNAFQ